ncbi:type 1 fimbrial protein [Vibrio cholerae]|uniref:Type 1 fimbrial protein n=1 Tax=Vibrio cholerae TaxID=666 RepID=A0A7Z7VIF0_VIBCL|nr:type 1 fimbrial protein [Vibrio cholerae]
MVSYQRAMDITVLLAMLIFSIHSYADSKSIKSYNVSAITLLKGSVIDAPCSISLQNRYQTIDFSSLALASVSDNVQREMHDQPFIIELQDCGSVYSTIDLKTWKIRFVGQSAQYIDAFILQGASEGVGISVLDNSKRRLQPNKDYLLSDNVLHQDKSGYSLFLRYFLRLELTGQPIQAGRYYGLIRFFIDYQ